MKLIILTPVGKLYENEVNAVTVPGYCGQFQILKNHAPIISILKEGIIRIKDMENKTQEFFVKKGLLESSDNYIKILAEQ
ncbi:MAG: ATP synthase F1 subunit epsilon [Bacteroidales bacterium]|nr:ATP synthase F1 subunit epsilon [Bacteroidales bacterium]